MPIATKHRMFAEKHTMEKNREPTSPFSSHRLTVLTYIFNCLGLSVA